MSVVRFGVSLEKELLEALDVYTKENHFSNRSQAIRQLVSNNLVLKKWQCNNIVAGSIILFYDHHKREVLNNLMDVQHHYYDVIMSSQHFHIDHDSCFEIVAVKGEAARLTELADKLIALKGINHGRLTMGRIN